MRFSFYGLIAALVFLPAAAGAGNPIDYGGINPSLLIAHWQQTKATGMADVGVARSGQIWLAGSNGTIWSSSNGETFDEESGISGFGRIAVGNDKGHVGAVGRDNHLLWIRGGISPRWFQSPATDVADIALGGDDTVWIAGTNGTIWYAESPAAFGYQIEKLQFKQIKADGFCRVASHAQLLWAVGCNGTLWKYRRDYRTNSAWDAGEWVRTPASGIADVAADESDTLWLTGQNGSVWKSTNGVDFVPISPPGSGFASIAAGNGSVYAVRTDGTLWRYKP